MAAWWLSESELKIFVVAAGSCSSSETDLNPSQVKSTGIRLKSPSLVELAEQDDLAS